MEPEGLLSRSEEPATFPNPYSSAPLLEDPF